MEEDFIIDNSELATIKKANEQIKVSKDEFERRIKIIAKSKRDIVWWAEHFFRIVSLNTGLGVIKLYDKQKQLLNHIATNDRSIVLAARQTGKCVFKDTNIIIRNKKNGDVKKVKISDFFNEISNKNML